MASGLGRIVAAAAWLLLPLAIGGLSGLATAGSVDTWYETIRKPVFNPPGWIFGPVWTALYLMMGLAIVLVRRAAWGAKAAPDLVRRATFAFVVQLVLNGLWSLLFFGLRRPGLALAEIVFLWVAIAWTIFAFRPLSRAASWLLVPYWLWVSFAAVLNGAIWWLNR